MLRCQFLCHVLKALFFYQNSSKIKLFLQKKCKIFERWGLRPQTPETAPPLQISGYAPDLSAGPLAGSAPYCGKSGLG